MTGAKHGNQSCLHFSRVPARIHNYPRHRQLSPVCSLERAAFEAGGGALSTGEAGATGATPGRPLCHKDLQAPPEGDGRREGCTPAGSDLWSPAKWTTMGPKGTRTAEAKPLLMSVDELQPDRFLVDGGNEEEKDARSGSRMSFLAPSLHSFTHSFVLSVIRHLITES